MAKGQVISVAFPQVLTLTSLECFPFPSYKPDDGVGDVLGPKTLLAHLHRFPNFSPREMDPLPPPSSSSARFVGNPRVLNLRQVTFLPQSFKSPPPP